MGADIGLPEAPFPPIPTPLPMGPLTWSSSVFSPALSTPPATPFPPRASSPRTPFLINHSPHLLSLYGTEFPLSQHYQLNCSLCALQLKTPLGKGRAFIRFCLVHGQLAESLQLCLLNPELTRWGS